MQRVSTGANVCFKCMEDDSIEEASKRMAEILAAPIKEIIEAVKKSEYERGWKDCMRAGLNAYQCEQNINWKP